MNFINYLKAKRLAPNTIKEIVREVNHLETWLESQEIIPQTTSHQDLLERLKALKLSPQSKNTLINTWRHYFTHLKEEGLMSYDPTEGLKLHNEVKKVVHFLSKETLKQLEENLKSPIHYKLTLSFILHQAADQTTLKRLEKHHINYDKGEVYLAGSRTKAARTLGLHPSQLLPLYRYTEILPDNLLFPFTLDNHLKHLLRKLKKIAPEVESIRQVRASVIHHWLKEDHLRAVQYRCGHKSIRSTEKYRGTDHEALKNQLESSHPFG